MKNYFHVENILIKRKKIDNIYIGLILFDNEKLLITEIDKK